MGFLRVMEILRRMYSFGLLRQTGLLWAQGHEPIAHLRDSPEWFGRQLKSLHVSWKSCLPMQRAAFHAIAGYSTKTQRQSLPPVRKTAYYYMLLRTARKRCILLALRTLLL